MSHGHSHGGDATTPLLKEEHGHGDAHAGHGGHGGHGGHEAHGGHGGHGGHDHDAECGCGDDHGEKEKAHGGHDHGHSHGGGDDHGHSHGGGHDHGNSHGGGCHGHGHGGHAEESQDVSKMRKAIYFAVFFMLVEIVGGVAANSLAIITDAAHMLSDVGGFIVSLVALKLSAMEATEQYSFGFQQADVIGAMFSIMIVWALTAVLLAEAVPRLIEPQELEAQIMLIIAIIGFVVNLILMKVLGHGHSHEGGHGHSHGGGGEEDSAAVQAALAHVIGDIVQSLGVCVAAACMLWQPFDIGFVDVPVSKGSKETKQISKWFYADPLCTVLFGILVLKTTKGTITRCVNTLMARAPDSINQTGLADEFRALPDVTSIHDLHVWSLGSKEVLCTAHIMTSNKENSMNVLKGAIEVAKKHGIGHSTFQIEIDGEFDPSLEHYGTLHKNEHESAPHAHGGKDDGHSHGGHGGHGHDEGHSHGEGGHAHGGGGHEAHGGHGGHGGHGH